MTLQTKIKNRAQREREQAAAEGKPMAVTDVDPRTEFIPRTLLDAARADLDKSRQHARKIIREQRTALDDAHDVMRELLRMTAPATVQTYQGGHRAHIAAVAAKVRDCLTRAGALVPRESGGRS